MLHLASKSPRRAQLLQQLGLHARLIDVSVIECRGADEPAADYVRRVARDKALAGLQAVAGEPGAVVLGADTEVVLDGEVFGKPEDAPAARAMLQRLSDRAHRVLSAVYCVSDGREAHALQVSEVRFAALDAATIDAYVESGEPFGKAGGYAIQGRAAAFIAHLSGSYSGVMGLPLHETAGLLAAHGIGAHG
jgi:septum formation protein